MKFRTYVPEGRHEQLLAFINRIPLVGGYDKYIYMNLANHAYKSDNCYVGQETLAEYAASSLRTVQRCLARLEKAGLIRTETQGKFKRYYLTIPKAFEKLAERYGLIWPAQGGAGMSGDAKPETHDNLSSKAESSSENHAAFDRTHDNLSHRNKNKSLYNNPPLSPQADSKPAHNALRRCGGAGSFSPAKWDEIQKEFQTLQAVYPRREDIREAFEVFVRSHGSLPPIGELISAVEYEKANNPKWQRDYAPYLKNWLKSRHFEAALQFMRAEAERAAAAAEVEARTPRLAEPGEAPAQEAIGPEQPFIEADFEACVSLWKPHSAIRSALAGYWRKLLLLGILPSVDAARSARAQFGSMQDWLKAFKQAEFSKNKSPVSNTNSSCRHNQACYAAA